MIHPPVPTILVEESYGLMTKIRRCPIKIKEYSQPFPVLREIIN
jgi:hypothetical protein